MGDIDNRNPAVAQFFKRAHEVLRFLRIQAGSRFVQQHDLGVFGERAQNLDHLLDGETQVPHLRLRVDLHVEAGGRLLYFFDQLLFRDQSMLAFPIGKDVFVYGKVFEDRKLLMDDRNPRRLRRQRMERLDRFAVDQNRAAVRRVFAGKHLDERGFARAVFAEQGMDFAAADIEADVLERMHRSKALGNAAHFQNVVVLLHGKNSLHKNMAAPEAKLRGQPFWRMTY